MNTQPLSAPQPTPVTSQSQTGYVSFHFCPDCNFVTPHVKKTGYHECVICRARLYVLRPAPPVEDGD